MRPLLPLALACLSLSAVPRQFPPEPFVPVSVWYGGGTVRPPLAARDPGAERDAWRRDLAAIRSLGFNAVRTWVDWAGAEAERGRYLFDALDQLLTLADGTGLKVIVQISTEPPAWVADRYPDAGVVGDRGERIGGSCADHAGVRADLSAFIAQATSRAAGHRSFYAVDVWRAPHAVGGPADPSAAFCFCPHTEARFRDWLKARYGSLDALNAGWSRAFTSWDQPRAPRAATALAADVGDWKTFVADKLRQDLRTRADAASSRGARPVTSHADTPSVLLGPLEGLGTPDAWWMSAAVDRYGASFHPKPAVVRAPWSAVRLASALDAARSASMAKGWWVGELQAGQAADGPRVGEPVTGSDLRLWGWAAISRGAQAISYYTWYPAAWGAGLVGLDGTVTARAKTAGEFAGVVGRNASLFAPLRPRRSRVAIVYNRLGYVAGGPGVAPSSAIARDSMLGIYRALFDGNVQADFVHADELVAGRAGAYDVVYLGDARVLSREMATALEAYVRDGGTLISEARPGSVDARGQASARVPGFGLDEVFGVRERQVRTGDRIVLAGERGLSGPLGPLAGRVFTGLAFAEALEVVGPSVRVLARFAGAGGAPGDPAVVMTPYGKGRAVLIGTFASAALEQDPDGASANGTMLLQLAVLAGVGPDVAIDGAAGSVEARFLESADALLLIAINHADTPQHVTLRFASDIPEAIWQNMETGAAVSFVQGPSGPVYTRDFAARDVMVLVRGKRLR